MKKLTIFSILMLLPVIVLAGGWTGFPGRLNITTPFVMYNGGWIGVTQAGGWTFTSDPYIYTTSASVGIGTSSPSSMLEIVSSEANGYLIVGDNTGNIGTNPAITIDRTTDAATEAAHGIEDRTVIYKDGSYAAFDCRAEIPADAVGEYSGKHIIGFQGSPKFSSTDNTLGDGVLNMEGLVGFASIPSIGAGATVDKIKHYVIDDVNFTGTANNQYGIYVHSGALSSASNNYLIYNNDANGVLYTAGVGHFGTDRSSSGSLLSASSVGSALVEIIGDADNNGTTEDVVLRFLEDGIYGGTGTVVGTVRYDKSDDAFGIGYGANRQININSALNVGIKNINPGTALEVTGIISNTAIQTTTLGVGVTTFAVTSNIIQLTGDGSGNTVATITGAGVGTYTIICVDANITITDTDAHTANTVDLVGTATNLTSADDLVLTLVFDGTSWYEISRSAN